MRELLGWDGALEGGICGDLVHPKIRRIEKAIMK